LLGWLVARLQAAGLRLEAGRPYSFVVQVDYDMVRKTHLFLSLLYIKTPSFYQDRLGTNTGKAEKKRLFSQGYFFGEEGGGGGGAGQGAQPVNIGGAGQIEWEQWQPWCGPIDEKSHAAAAYILVHAHKLHDLPKTGLGQTNARNNPPVGYFLVEQQGSERRAAA
jgi:hypothetical protein